MTGMSDEVLYDKRLIDRHIRLGLITREEVDKRLATAPDLTDEGAVIDVEAMQREIEGLSKKLHPAPGT